MDIIETSIDFIKELFRKKNEGEMRLVDYKRKTIAYITSDTPLMCHQRGTDLKFYGYNLNAVIDNELVLLETYDDDEDITGRELCENAITSIKDGFTAGATYFIIPSN